MPRSKIQIEAAPETLRRIVELRGQIANARASIGARWAEDPVGFVTDRLGEFLWSKQADVLTAIRDHRLVAVRSCHGVGKTRTASRAVAWWVSAHPPDSTRVVTTAPTFKQVQLYQRRL